MREVSGKFNNLRWLFVWLTQLLYFVIPWLKWNDRPAVWFDLEKRFFYIFGLDILTDRRDLHDHRVDYLRIGLVPVHGSGWAFVVRLHLPADGLHGNFHVD